MRRCPTALLYACAVLLSACATAPTGEQGHSPADDLGLRWVKSAAEYRAITRQVYAAAGDDLAGFVADPNWSALPWQSDAGELPPAVILDVDETVVSNVDFQLVFERPFANWKLEQWASETTATPVQGVVEFVAEARRQGVTVFFVTNRPCEPKPGNDDPCPQRQTTIDGIGEVGIQTDAAHVFLSEERGWTREKITRREHIGQNYRVLMLIGDDFGDFVPCVRKKIRAPCTVPATAASRAAALDEYDRYWGRGWYILPNPMHGSWTSID
ncbi:MAG: HAD family acid phosphatase [Pseudomonadota bacterium]